MTILHVDDETAARLRQLAALSGAASVEEYLRMSVGLTSRGPASTADFESELEPLLSDGPTLPADFSRADIYAEHD